MGSSARSASADLTYDLVTILQNKAKALEAYDKHLRDRRAEAAITSLLQELRQDEERHVRLLKQAVARRLDEDVRLEDEDEMNADELQASDEHYDDESALSPGRGSTHRRT